MTTQQNPRVAWALEDFCGHIGDDPADAFRFQMDCMDYGVGVTGACGGMMWNWIGGSKLNGFGPCVCGNGSVKVKPNKYLALDHILPSFISIVLTQSQPNALCRFSQSSPFWPFRKRND